MTDLPPREIVSELDRFIIGQNDAKRAVAVALPEQVPQYSRGHDNRCEEKISGVCHVVLDCCYGRIL